MEFEKLKEVIASVLSVDPDEITMESTFMDDLGADSLDVFQIVMRFPRKKRKRSPRWKKRLT